MIALIFAAGRGERMRPLSDRIPKPLLMAGGRRLVEWQIAALAAAGIRDLVINTAHCAQLIESTLGDGARYGVRIRYSREGERAEDALETLGGIVRALGASRGVILGAFLGEAASLGFAGALIGLQFVVMTLIAGRPRAPAQEAGAAFATPTRGPFST